MTPTNSAADACPAGGPSVNGSSRRWWAAGALALIILMINVDSTVLNVALPNISVSLNTSISQLQWIVDAYNLLLAGAMLPGALLGDRYGRKRILLCSLAVFTLAAPLCAFAQNAPELIGARALMGLGAASLAPLTLAMLPVMFGLSERSKALALMMAITVAALPIGPVLGGWLLTHSWWGSVFLINVPVCTVALVAVAILVPESRDRRRPGPNAGQVVLCSVGPAAVTFGLIGAGQDGWNSATCLVVITLGCAAVIGYVAWERVSKRPMLNLSLFRSSAYTWGTLLAALVSLILAGLVFTVPQYFQTILGSTPLNAGLEMLPLVGGLFFGSVMTRALVGHVGANLMAAAGFVAVLAGLCMAALTHLGTAYGYAATWLSILGLGLGLALPTAMDAATGQLSAERSGIGTATISMLCAVDGTLGVAILGSLLNWQYRSRLPLPGERPSVVAAIHRNVMSGMKIAAGIGSRTLDAVSSAFVHGMDVVLSCCGAVALCCAIMAAIRLPSRSAGSPRTDQSGDVVAAPMRGRHRAPRPGRRCLRRPRSV